MSTLVSAAIRVAILAASLSLYLPILTNWRNKMMIPQ